MSGSTSATFHGGPRDGVTVEMYGMGCRYLEVPLFQDEAIVWEKRTPTPRIKPRGFRVGVYEWVGDRLVWVGVQP